MSIITKLAACLHHELIQESTGETKPSTKAASAVYAISACICALTQVPLSLCADKEKPHKSCLNSDDQSTNYDLEIMCM